MTPCLPALFAGKEGRKTGFLLGALLPEWAHKVSQWSEYWKVYDFANGNQKRHLKGKRETATINGKIKGIWNRVYGMSFLPRPMKVACRGRDRSAPSGVIGPMVSPAVSPKEWEELQ